MNKEIKEILKVLEIKSKRYNHHLKYGISYENTDEDYQAHLLLDYITNLQSKIDKAIEWIEQYEKQIGILGETNKSIVLTDDVVIGNLLDILKEDK